MSTFRRLIPVSCSALLGLISAACASPAAGPGARRRVAAERAPSAGARGRRRVSLTRSIPTHPSALRMVHATRGNARPPRAMLARVTKVRRAHVQRFCGRLPRCSPTKSWRERRRRRRARGPGDDEPPPADKRMASPDLVVAGLRPRFRQCFSHWIDEKADAEGSVRFALELGCAGNVQAITADDRARCGRAHAGLPIYVVGPHNSIPPANGHAIIQVPVVFKSAHADPRRAAPSPEIRARFDRARRACFF